MMPARTDRFAEECKDIAPDTEVIMMTAYATIERAVEAMKEGATTSLLFRRAQIERVVKRAMEKQHLPRKPRSQGRARNGSTRRRRVLESLKLRAFTPGARHCAAASPSTATVLLMVKAAPLKSCLLDSFTSYLNDPMSPLLR